MASRVAARRCSAWARSAPDGRAKTQGQSVGLALDGQVDAIRRTGQRRRAKGFAGQQQQGGWVVMGLLSGWVLVALLLQ